MLRAAYVPVHRHIGSAKPWSSVLGLLAASMCTAGTSQKAELPHQKSFDVLQAGDAAPELEQQLPSRRVEVPRRAHLGMCRPMDFPACATHCRIPQETTELDRVPQVQQPILRRHGRGVVAVRPRRHVRAPRFPQDRRHVCPVYQRLHQEGRLGSEFQRARPMISNMRDVASLGRRARAAKLQPPGPRVRALRRGTRAEAGEPGECGRLPRCGREHGSTEPNCAAALRPAVPRSVDMHCLSQCERGLQAGRLM